MFSVIIFDNSLHDREDYFPSTPSKVTYQYSEKQTHFSIQSTHSRTTPKSFRKDYKNKGERSKLSPPYFS